MASEASIQSNIIDYINSLPHGRAENVSGNAQQSGRADINACIKGRMLKIEVKTDETEYGRKGASLKQRLYLERWARAGAITCVVYCVDDVKWLLRHHGFDGFRVGDYVLKDDDRGTHWHFCKEGAFNISGRGKWYDVQNKRWVDISY